jgi:molybdopterin/thiamine biosynthesis adenylyltransferase
MIDRYSRQILFSKIGKKGQEKLRRSYAVVVGCGGLGCIIAAALVRAGVGRVRLIDRDIIEFHNLHRQVLFNEEDVKKRLPKAVAAEKHLKKVNSEVEIEGVVADVNYATVEKLIYGADVILDGLDNPETRFILNDAALKHKVPWVYGSAVSASGRTLTIIPGKTPCFRCVSPTVPHKGVIPTCDTAGVIGPAPFIIGSFQAAEAMKLLLDRKAVNQDMLVIDLWENSFNRYKVSFRKGCPACRGDYEFLQPEMGIRSTVLCSQNAVQVQDPALAEVSLSELDRRLSRAGKTERDSNTLRFEVEGHELVIFPDGRGILRNSLDESLARKLYLKYVLGKRRNRSGKGGKGQI